jgi:hypothetical protein
MGEIPAYSFLKNKKGSGDLGKGVNIAIMFFGGVITLILLGFLVLIIAGSLSSPGDAALPAYSGTLTNETLTTVDDAGEDLSVRTLHLVDCSVTAAYNATGGEEITSGNYTETNCNVAYTGVAGGRYNNTNWDVMVDYTYKTTGIRDTLSNVSVAIPIFFSNALTWFSLLSVVIVIATVVIVVRMVRGGTSRRESL